jgi:hypothetical protein
MFWLYLFLKGIYIMEIYYDGKLGEGQHLTTEETQMVPFVSLRGLDTNKKYILIMNDPDAVGGNRIHWIVSNISGNYFNSGTHLLFYRGPAPPKNSGIHNYIFSLYEMTRDFHLFFTETNRRINMFHLLATLNITGQPIYQTRFTSQNSQEDGTFQKLITLLKKYTGLLLLVTLSILIVLLYIIFFFRHNKKTLFTLI